MVSNENDKLLFVEPTQTSKQPLIDELTRKMTAAWRRAKESEDGYRGVHQCTGAGCGATSTNKDHFLPGGMMTHSLCVHDLAFHRDEIPESELAKVRALTYGEEEPNEDELRAPGYVPERQRVTRG